MSLLNFDDPIMKERNGKKAVWIDREIHKKLLSISQSKGKKPQTVAEYLLALGLSTDMEKPTSIVFDIDAL